MNFILIFSIQIEPIYKVDVFLNEFYIDLIR